MEINFQLRYGVKREKECEREGGEQDLFFSLLTDSGS